jgi:hypothetical protein
MHIRYFGDSYDIVKHSLIRWLAAFGEWAVHPMFTESVSGPEAAAFGSFLGARVLSTDVLAIHTSRPGYFASAATAENLFLDPDTGLRVDPVRGARAPEFLFTSELVSLVEARPRFLTLVFDQSHPRGSERASLKRKLRHLSDRGVPAFAYLSHACFIIAGGNTGLAGRARADLLAASRLPESRLVVLEPNGPR